MTYSIVDNPEDELENRLDELKNQDDIITNVDDLEESIVNDEEIPTKYRGKDTEDLIKMHSEAEKLISRQGAELGELRKSVDSILYNQANNKGNKKETDRNTEEREFDLLEPEKSVDERITNHPSIKRIEQLEQSLAFKEFETKHPKWQETVSTPEFNEWVSKSPSRLNMYQQADYHNYNQASDLLGQWEEWRDVVSTATKEEKKMKKEGREKQLNEGMTESGSSTGTSRKKFRKIDLRRLYISDPERYNSMSDEIQQAYLDGRVI
mgnify:CR=1 FL=1